MDYRDTVELPKTDFPMRAGLANSEPKRLAKWNKENYYDRLQQIGKEENRPRFILHDGPPYANGHIHIGTATNKILKDMVVRSKSMDGYMVPYVPGWDTHGLPIESQVVKEKGQRSRELGQLQFRRLCRDYALRYVDIQRDEFRRLGVWADWDNPYVTLEPEYEARQIELFGEMAKRGYIYKGKKPVYWCAHCETALAEAEIEYDDHVSPSIFVAFPVKDGQNVVSEGTHVIIWTTTPWTLPANLAIAVHPDFTYVEAGVGDETYLVAKDLVQQLKDQLGWEHVDIKKEHRGVSLEGVVTSHPFIDRPSPIILGEHVTLEAGTGCVHTAPGHGIEDYEVGQRYGLDVLAPVDSKGRYTDEAGPFVGLNLTEGNRAVMKQMETDGTLLFHEETSHSYPHCWRCKEPVIFRATEQWFASVDAFRDEAIKAIEQVTWVPSWGIDRIRNMVADRSDWCISRQRTWGVPIPIFYCDGCDESIVTEESIQSVVDLFREHGSDGWYTHEANEILPEGTSCHSCGGKQFRKEEDIMDVWFDSGSSHQGVLEAREELTFPADMYLEGSDQHRGWFQSSLLTSVATKGVPPYKSVLTHGFIVDGDGRKMSKSIGNTVAPDEVTDKIGADVLRLWASAADYRNDIRVSDEILDQSADVYRRIRNTCRFILGNLHDFDPDQDRVPYDQLEELDKWAVIKTHRLLEKGIQGYRDYAFHVVHQQVHHFCSVDMGGFYLDVIKDRLYCDGKDSHSRRSAQSAMSEVLIGLVKLIAPILVFTADEVWDYMPEDLKEAESVHFTTWPRAESLIYDDELEQKWNRFLAVRRVAARALERARDEKIIRSGLAADVAINVSDSDMKGLEDFRDKMADLLMVAQVRFEKDAASMKVVEREGDVLIGVDVTAFDRCDRCWRHTHDVGEDEAHPTLCARCAHVVE